MTAHILLIDDEQEIRDLLSEQLEEQGFTTKTAEDGAKGIELLQSGETFDLVFMDVMMPKKNGIETLIELRKIDGPAGHLPVIMITGFSDKKLIAKCIEHGINDYIVKPWEISQLKGRIHDAKVLNLNYEDVKTMVGTSHIDDSTLLTQNGLRRFCQNEYSAFPRTHQNMSLAFIVKQGEKNSDLAKLNNDELVKRVKVFHKKDEKWVYCWPSMGDCVQPKG